MAEYITYKRVWTDDVTFDKLSDLFQITRGSITRYRLYRTMLEEWIDSGGDKKIGNVILTEYTIKNHCVWITVEESLWDDFKTLCYMRELDINIGFRIAVYRFINLIDEDNEILMRLLYDGNYTKRIC